MMTTCYCIDLLLSGNPLHTDGGKRPHPCAQHMSMASSSSPMHPQSHSQHFLSPIHYSMTLSFSFSMWIAHHCTSARLSHCLPCPSYCSLFQAHSKWHSSLGSIPYLQDRVSYPFPVFPDSVGSTSLIALVTEYFDIFIALSVSWQTNFLHLPPTKSTICFTVGIQKKRMS